MYSLFCSLLRLAISQAGIAARTLTLMQGFEEKEKKYAAQNEPERKTCQTHALITTPQRRRFRLVKVSYLTRAKEKKKQYIVNIWIHFAKILPTNSPQSRSYIHLNFVCIFKCLGTSVLLGLRESGLNESGTVVHRPPGM